MKAGLVVNPVTTDIDSNLQTVISMTNEAVDRGSELVVFPEAALTGLIINGNPTHDIPLGEVIPGQVTEKLATLTHERGIYLAIGLLEVESGKLFDSAVLLGPEGNILLKYRRISKGWHSNNADPSVYCQGTDILLENIPSGSIAILICGDLFDDELVQRVRVLNPDLLLLPFARCFPDGSYSQEKWEEEEQSCYVERVEMIGSTTLMTNYLAVEGLPDGNSFGGAMAVMNNGRIIDKLVLGQPGIMIVDM